MQLSKSDYLLYLKHPAWLWLKKHDETKLPQTDDAAQSTFDAGHNFEAYAEALFENAVSLGFDDYVSYVSLTRRTQQALKDGATTIFQSRFVWGEYTCLPDIVTTSKEHQVDLYEIKSSTKVKEAHLHDLAFQRAVIEANDLIVRRTYIIYVNNDYVRCGDIEPAELTNIEDVTAAVRDLESFTISNMSLALETIKRRTMPDPSPAFLSTLGNKKDWQAIYEKLVPTKAPDYQNVQPTIQKQAIQTFIDSLRYPLYFLDYETMSAAVPYFDGHRPYQQIPTQYSLHILDSPGAELRHTEYLHREKSDPSLPIAQHLISDIGTSGSIITWNMSFEKACNVTLGRLNPDYAEVMEDINQRIVDLMIPFKSKNGWYSDPRFEGSASIKKILPVVVPSLSYKELNIQNGAAAQTLWMQAVLDSARDDKETILDDLIKYCRLDTLAMVEIFQKLIKVVQ